MSPIPLPCSFRLGRTFGQAKGGKTSKKGKVNLSTFGSQQKRVINEKRVNPQIPKGIVFVYRSEQYGTTDGEDGDYSYGES